MIIWECWNDIKKDTRLFYGRRVSDKRWRKVLVMNGYYHPSLLITTAYLEAIA